MNILITGGAGYIGSHIAKRAAESGFRPIVFDNLSTGHRWAVKWGPLVEADLCDSKALVRTLETHSIEAVVHCAASADVAESMSQPSTYFRNNVSNTLNVLDGMLRCGVRTLVFSSSCAVYGTLEENSVCENDRVVPLSPYGESKLMAEAIIRWYGKLHGLKWLSMRYFNIGGADLTGAIGEAHLPETHLIPRAIMAALKRLDHVNISGTDYDTVDGTAVRDYLHVVDLADAHMKAISYLRSGDSCTLNVGSGQGLSVKQIIAAVERVAKRSISIRHAPRRPGDPARIEANIDRTIRALEWTPKLSQLDAIISSAWNWHANCEPRYQNQT
jgi:UDP-glucose-4-epimerase GalE